MKLASFTKHMSSRLVSSVSSNSRRLLTLGLSLAISVVMCSVCINAASNTSNLAKYCWIASARVVFCSATAHSYRSSQMRDIRTHALCFISCVCVCA